MQQCLICQRRFSEKSVVRLPCGHNFCEQCYVLIQRYQRRHSSESPTRSESESPPMWHRHRTTVRGICPLCDVSRKFRKKSSKSSSQINSNLTTRAPPTPFGQMTPTNGTPTWRSSAPLSRPDSAWHSTATNRTVLGIQ